MKRYFFTPSLDAQTQLSAFFQFFWTAASAMWNLRWQVQGFSSAYPGCSESDLQQRFVLGSEIHGASLKRTCIENTWDQNRGTFGQFLLFQSFGIYESWIADILDLLGEKNREIEKGLQFPSDLAKKTGIRFALQELTAKKSPLLDSAFFGPGVSSDPFIPDRVENLLICYRAFKECRNCLAHDSGICSPEAESSCRKYATVSKASDMGVNELPEMPVQTAGAPVRLTLRGCVGFTDVILKLIATIDLQLCHSVKAESPFVDDLSSRISALDRNRLLSSEKGKRRKTVRKMIYGLGYPKPEVDDAFCDWLKSKRVIKF